LSIKALVARALADEMIEHVRLRTESTR
jgi:hypothetical protein